MNKILKAKVCAILAAGIVLLMFVADFFGEHRIFGYEMQVDVASARTRYIRYFVFIPIKDRIEINAVAVEALALRPNIRSDWRVAVERPLLRRRSERTQNARLLISIKIIAGILEHSKLSVADRKQLTLSFLDKLQNKEPREVGKWVDSMWDRYQSTFGLDR